MYKRAPVNRASPLRNSLPCGNDRYEFLVYCPRDDTSMLQADIVTYNPSLFTYMIAHYITVGLFFHVLIFSIPPKNLY